CDGLWDNVACWPDTPAGQTAVQPCPPYVKEFRKDANATRQCTEDGTWYFLPETNQAWSNYNFCSKVEEETFNVSFNAVYLRVLKQVVKFGYALSMVALFLAIFITLYFRYLRCPRNILHINLYLSFIVRAFTNFLKEMLFFSGMGLRKDFIHWECKLLMSLFNYSIVANAMWIFVEGLYIHTLIFFDIYVESSQIHWYIALGWGLSLLVIIPWVVTKALLEDVLCWNVHSDSTYFWIIRGPVTICLVLSFIFFLNIIRALFTKLRNNSSESRNNQHKTLAKSTLLLIPLFGVPYVIFLWMPDKIPDVLDTIRICFELTFHSFNGFLVALLFCFLNTEVSH
ncbi:hypothetical protein HELRODRAFT_72863, partial [Helobdella robusta]|uniref:G-protein coupled receptors family 2 profile 2 domain-containing protein n=1 Tax=Helobdella robusta TaxID=6412 RepID=T1G164_HELRO